MNPRYAPVALRAGHRCEYCRAPEVVFNFPFEVEHIIPVSRGGLDTESNWALACRSCNLRKATHLSGIDPENQVIVRLFHPREDRWEEHFQLDIESGRIEGLTVTGRVTVARLEIREVATSEMEHCEVFRWFQPGKEIFLDLEKFEEILDAILECIDQLRDNPQQYVRTT